MSLFVAYEITAHARRRLQHLRRHELTGPLKRKYKPVGQSHATLSFKRSKSALNLS